MKQEVGSRMKSKHSADEETYEFEEEVCSRCIVYKMKHDGLMIDSFKRRIDMS